VVKFLISQGADVNAQRCDGMTPLHTQVKSSIVKTLLCSGADPNITDISGMTPLHSSLSLAKTRLLLNAGADCNARDEDGDFPEDCYRASSKKMIKLVKEWRCTHKKPEPGIL
jgi:ankyrin repeat protein